MIDTRSRTHLQLSPLTIGITELKVSDDVTEMTLHNVRWRYITELKVSDDVDIFWLTFETMMPLRSIFCSVSRAFSQRLVILRKFWQVFHQRFLLERCFRGCVLPVLEYSSAVYSYTTGPFSQWSDILFFKFVWVCHCASICGSIIHAV